MPDKLITLRLEILAFTEFKKLGGGTNIAMSLQIPCATYAAHDGYCVITTIVW